jgi:hypothetical protein
MLGDIAAGPAFRFTQWLQLVRKRTSNYRSSGFPRHSSTTMLSNSRLLFFTTLLAKFVIHPYSEMILKSQNFNQICRYL